MLAILPADLDRFSAICQRERCPFAVLGTMNDSGRLEVRDPQTGDNPVAMDMHALLGKPPQTEMTIGPVAAHRTGGQI